MQEALTATGAVPPGNAPGNREWITRKKKVPKGANKPELRLDSQNASKEEVALGVAELVKAHGVVAFIKGTRKGPECGFSEAVVKMLQVRERSKDERKYCRSA